MSQVSIILLAAGSSSRMGQSKQLLSINEQPLLLHTAKEAMQSIADKTVVVLGSEFEKHNAVIDHLPLKIIENKNWENGMGGSLKVGLNYLMNTHPDLNAILVLVCDQPLLTFSHLNKIIENYHQTKKNIVASYYSDTPGVPALFSKALFSELLNLPDDQGAKKIINKYKSTIEQVDFPGGKIDLDTWEEYEHFKKTHP